MKIGNASGWIHRGYLNQTWPTIQHLTQTHARHTENESNTMNNGIKSIQQQWVKQMTGICLGCVPAFYQYHKRANIIQQLSPQGAKSECPIIFFYYTYYYVFYSEIKILNRSPAAHFL